MSSHLSFNDPAGRECGFLELRLAVTLASAIVHAQELLGSLSPLPGAEAALFDAAALRDCVEAPEVLDWLEAFPPGLLPVKREGAGDG